MGTRTAFTQVGITRVGYGSGLSFMKNQFVRFSRYDTVSREWLSQVLTAERQSSEIDFISPARGPGA